MLRPQNYTIAGYVQPGYCAQWEPPAGLMNISHPLMSFNLRRLPGYPAYEIAFDQWAVKSGGGAQFVGDPYAVRLYQSLSWPSICTADRDSLETFFRTVARAQSDDWTWWNPTLGNSMPVRFADADFPATPEIGYGYHQLSGLRLMMDINYPGLVPTGVASYTANMGTALSIGSVIMQMPAPNRPGTGYGVALPYSMENPSSGVPVVYRTGKTSRRDWTLSWSNLRYIHWIRIQSFFMTFVRGMRQEWTWYDIDGTARILRLAEPKITVQQLGYDRFSCSLAVTEDI